MFVFYFGIVADITPPVALASYAGSAISGVIPIRTLFIATRLAIAAFIIPYIFVLNPAMLLIDTSFVKVVQIIITSTIGMFAISGGMEGFMTKKMPWWERVLAVIGGLALIDPKLITDIIGIVIYCLCHPSTICDQG